MSDHNPFHEPQDDPPTVMQRPMPGGQRATPPSPSPLPPSTSPPAPARRPDDLVELPPVGQSDLLTAASPLLQLLARLSTTETPPDPMALRERTVQALGRFRTAAQAGGIGESALRDAHYSLCAAIDDVVMNSPWGSQSQWVKNSLVGTFHKDVISGEEFYDKLDILKRQPATNLPLLELMYLCLSLGYKGQFRLIKRSRSDLESIRQDLHSTIVSVRPDYEPALSPHWQGVDAPYRRNRATVPIWVMAAVAVTLVAIAYVLFIRNLGSGSDQALAMAAQLPPTQLPGLDRTVPAPPPPPEPVQPARITHDLNEFLAPEIAAHQVTVAETPQTIDVRVFNGGMFASGSATVRADFVSLLERIGSALNDEPGHVVVTGHTDNQPIHTAQFPSNYQLSLARARAASDIMLRRLHDPTRLTIDGRGDAQPIASNDTPGGRQQNRRIDIVLQRQGS